MRKLKVSIICTLAVLLCCAFALLFTNLYNGAKNDQTAQSSSITRPEQITQTTATTNSTIIDGFDSTGCPANSTYSESYTHQSKTYYKTITVPYTGSAITVKYLSSMNGASGTLRTPNCSSGITCNTGGCTMTISSGAIGTYTVEFIQNSFHPSGAPSDVYVQLVYASNNNASTKLTVVVKNTVQSISPTVSYSSTMTYGGSQTLKVNGNTGGGNVTWTLTNGTGKATLSSTTAASPTLKATQAGTVKVKASVAAKGDYAAGTTPEVTITISKASLTLTLSYSSVVVGTTASPTLGGNSGGGAATYTVTNGTGAATINSSTGVLTPTAVGTVTVKVTTAATTNYAAGTKSITVTIGKGSISPTISYTTVTFGSNSAAPTVGGNTGNGTKTFSIANGTGKATINSSTGVITPTQAGTVTVTVSIAATTNYNAGSKSVTVTINKASISPTISYSTVTFGSNSAAPTVGGNTGGGSVSYSVAAGTGKATINASTGVITPTQAGTVTVTVSIAATTNYNAGSKAITVTINKASISPTISYSAVTYGSNSAAPTVGGNTGNGTKSYTIANGTGKATVNASTGVITPTQAGTVTVTVNIAATTNYLAGSKSVTVTINKANISPTITYATITFGANSTAPTVSGAGDGARTFTIANGTGKATINASTGVISPTQAGTVVVTLSVAAATNYNEGSKSITVTINKKAISPTLSYSTVTYGTNSAAPTLGGNTGGGTPSYSVAAGTGKATINATTGVISPTQAGTVSVTVSIPATTNYAAGNKTISVTINKAAITVTLSYGTITYGSNSGAPTIGGNPGGGTPSFTIANGTGKATVSSAGIITPTQAGTVNITVSIPATTNYLDGSKTITVTINKANISPSIVYSTVTYGKISAAPTVTNAGDGVKTFAVEGVSGIATVNSANGVLTPTQAGTVKVTLTVAAATNYNAGSASVTVTIDKAAVSPDFTYATVTYGTNSAAPTVTGNDGNTSPSWSVVDGTGKATIDAVTGILTPVQAGTVEVTLNLPTNTNYLAGSKTVTITINKKAIAPDFSYTEITFGTPSDAPVITGNTDNGTVSFMVAAGTGSATINPETGIISPTKAGSVTVTLNVAATTNYAAATKNITVTINRLKVAEPKFDTASDKNTAGLVFTNDLTAKLVFTGAQVYVAVSCPDNWATSMDVELIGSVDEASWVASSGSAFVVTSAFALADSTHGISFTLKNDNFEFISGGKIVTLSLRITKQPVALPFFNTASDKNTENLVFTDDRNAAFEYAACQVYIAVTNVENWSRYMEAVLSNGVDAASWAASTGLAFVVNEDNARGATKHTITFNISDDNYEFENGETTVTLTLTISKAKLALPAFNGSDAQNSVGVSFNEAYTSAQLGYTRKDVYLGLSLIANWDRYMEAVLTGEINENAWAIDNGKAVKIDVENALANTDYSVKFTITNDNYVFADGGTVVTLTVEITAKDINDEDITISLDKSAFVYNGLTQSPVVTLEHSGALSEPVSGSDFTVEFINSAGVTVSKPTDAGTYTVVVSGVENYVGECRTMKFTISPAEITDTTITLSQTEYGYDGKAKTPEVEIKIGETVISSTFYTKTYKDNLNAGTATLTLAGIINLAGETTIEFTINLRDIAVVSFSTLESYEYTGNAYTPKPTVTDSELGNNLVLGRDFEFSYEHNTDAGTAKVIVTAMGNYGGTAYATFEITPRDITIVLIGAIESQTFDGTAKRPVPEITDYKIAKTLVEGVDFEFVYENNYDAGIATLHINGKNNYTGTYSFPYTINKRSLENATFVSIDAQIYDGNNKTPTANITENGLTLRLGLDYDISYTNNLNAGEATMTITGIGNYTGRNSFTFTIYAKALDNSFEIDGVLPSYVYTGSAITPTPTVTWNGKTLSPALDYEVSYSDGINAGTTVLVTISGKGNYTGSKLVEYVITKATPTVAPELAEYENDKVLHAGWGLPDIEATVVFNGEEVTGVLAWQKVNGEQPKLADGERAYGWVFTPTGDSAVNFNVVTGEMTITAEPVDVEKITVTLTGDSKTYRAFEKFDPTTISVVATLNDGTELMIPKDYDIIYIDGRDCLWATDTYVIISHTTRDKTVTAQFDEFTVVKATPMVTATVEGTPAVGEPLETVTLTFAEGDTAGTYEWTTPEVILSTGLHSFTFKFTPEDEVNYEDYEGSVEINIVIITDVTAAFFQGDAELFISDGLDVLESYIENSTVQLTVKVYYSDGSSKTLTLNAEEDGYTLQIAGDTLSEDGEVTVVYEENGTIVTKSFKATVTLIEVVRIEAEFVGEETVYTDSTLDYLKRFVKVTAYYNNDASKEVTAFALGFEDGATKLTEGESTITVDYNGDYKDESCLPVNIVISSIVKHQSVISFTGKTVYTYNGEEQIIDSGAELNHAQTTEITYTVDGGAAAFTNVPESGKIIVTVNAAETEDYYAAEAQFEITVRKAQTLLDLSYIKRDYVYNGEEQTVTGAMILNGEEGAEIVYANNAFTNVPLDGKLTVKITVAESENYLGAKATVEVTIEKAKIDVNASGEKLYFTGDYLGISLDEKNEDGTYKNVLTAVGDTVKITYSKAYLEGADAIPEPEDEAEWSMFKPELTGVGKYVINVRVASNENYETYYGQWLVEVADGTPLPPAPVEEVFEIPVWAIALIAVCAGLSLVAVAVAAASIKKKPAAADNDGFYDTVDESYLA